jgi:Tol biopolymer transport system component
MRKILLFILFEMLIFSGCKSSLVPKERLAYSHLTEGYWQVWFTDLNRAGSRHITTSPFDKRHPVWLDGGSTIMYRTNNGELYTLDVESGKEQRMLEKLGQVSDPDWSNAMGLLTFTRFSPNLADDSEIWTISLDGSGQRVLTNLQGMQYNPSFSPDGEKIAYVSGKGFGTHEIWVMDIDGKNQKRLTENKDGYDILPDWSPDGKRIAFASDRTGNLDIWVVDSDDGSQKRLTHYEGLDTYPAWSSDGRDIYFVSNRSGELRIWKVDYLSGEATQVTSGQGESIDPACVGLQKNKE